MSYSCQEDLTQVEPISFNLGDIVLTLGVNNLINGDHTLLLPLLNRHKNCDWGNCCEEDAALNNIATIKGHRILSSYELLGSTIWIITECDRSVTTFLLPIEY